MNLKYKNCKNPTWLVLPVTAALMAAGATFSAYGATAAGTEIKNLATVSYEDAAGNSFTAQSNEAVVTVAQVFSATINSTDTVVSAAPGQPVDISYTLENTGNGSDTYQLAAVAGHTTPHTIDASNVTIYEDQNNNGQADPGEPVISSLTLDSGELVSVVVRADVPTNAVPGDNLGVTLTANAEEGTGAAVTGSVIDLTTAKGPDALDSTVETFIDVTGDAVIVTTKSSLHDSNAKTITYTMTVRNNGNSDATNVRIQDAFPENTTFVAGSATTSGILAGNNDSVPAPTILNETADGADYNNDGDTLDVNLDGISATDAVLPPNATVTITYTVEYDETTVPGGTVISNVGYVIADVDGDGVEEPAVATNQTNDTVLDTLLVSIVDTGESGDANTNDGQDDDALNDIQFVSQVAAGDTVVFTNIITNGANTADVMELSLANGNFPPGTVFTFWNEDGTVQLNDSNGQFGVDAGLIPAYGSETITVRAQLPAGFAGTGPYDATVTVTSATDPTISDTVTERLGAIGSSTIDIHNAAGGVAGIDDDPIGNAPFTAVNTSNTDVNTTVIIPLWIDNDGDEDNSYQLDAGSIYDETTAAPAVSEMHDGWTVEFFLTDGAGNPTGNPITTTPVIPGNTTDFEIIAVVTVPASQVQAVDDFVFDNDGDGTADTLDGNNDGDGDYPIFFQISSANTGASDVTMEAIDITPVVTATLGPNGFTQIEAGGTEEFRNSLSNNGNATETYEVVSSNSQPGWSSTVSVDTDGDGVEDTELENLQVGPIQVLQPNGSIATVEVAIGTNGPTFTLDAGEVLPMKSDVFAPANAPDGQTDVLTITATNINSNDVLTAANQSQAVSGQIDVVKTVAIDAACDGTADGIFTAVPSTEVKPDECLIWKIVSQNQGSATAFDVKVFDAAPAFTTFVPGSLSYCQSFNCAPAAVTNGAGDDEGEESAGDVVFYIGTGAIPASGTGGELVSGDYATVQFSVRVD